MTTETIFEGETTPPVVELQSSTPAPAISTEFAELVGEGKKYKTAEDALRSIPHAQSHIQKLEEEAKQLRDELAKRKAAEELLEDFKATGFKPQGQEDQPPKAEPVDYEQIVASVLAKKEAQTKAQQNIDTVISTFKNAFGDKDKAEEMYTKVALESGLSIPALNQLAATSPEAVMRLAGITKKQEQPAGKVQSTVNLQSTQQGTTELSARVKAGASTKDLVSAVQRARAKVEQQFNS